MEYMGTKEAAEKLKVKPSTVSAWCREGRILGAEQDAPGSPWRIPSTFTRKDLKPKRKK
ncbi:MAG: helix-turn-helix domain-containing protein [Clostridia bacterium]|nr:helix-turn-helix domain-containing protein [Clostridia bacterium]